LPYTQNGQDDEGEQWAPPPRKPVVVRFLRALKRQYHRYAAESEKRKSDHKENERTTAVWTRQVGIFTIVIAFIAAMNVGIVFLQWRTMEKSDQTLRKTIEATQRPWLKIDVSLKDNIPLKSEKTPLVSVSVTIKNAGNGVASHVQPSVLIGKSVTFLPS
jgi:hypothetical protein